MATDASALSSRPLYNTTFTLFRLSPLHLPRNTTPSSFPTALQTHARRLAEHLQRDAQLGLSVPGLGVINDNDTLARAGRLQGTKWTWMSASRHMAAEDAAEPDTENLGGPDGLALLEGVCVSVEFERAEYAALLLRRVGGISGNDLSTSSASSSRLVLPLAILRMPVPLRSALFSYIAAHFDARADPIHVPEQAIANCLEAYLMVYSQGDQSQEDDERPRIAKDIQLTLAFTSPELRSIDITVEASDVEEFTKRGIIHDLRDRAPAVKDTINGGFATGPFTRALSSYLATHLGLDCNHSAVSLARVACGGFALGREGRFKVFAPSSSDNDGKEVIVGLVGVLWDLVRDDKHDQEIA